ncbi:hypothetical protein FHR24_000140 [Wenyingzhuangia heitensis]|uniref:Uncharacterized protein n=1 Tax=Wenyingzhuangia heitensis TaxID=1487859 RepID=A0ABX0U7V2_9FLAO|nr:hypothetical protein [Wenyingzhuangia heitensis]NIJ43701.1 hypothetical protein [Wenyingzhuangia heitensis]
MEKKDVYSLRKGNIPRGNFSEFNFSHATIRKRDEKSKVYFSFENSGSVKITKYDFEKRIYSGTFSFKAVNRDDPNDIIEINDGRFDIDVDKLSQEFKDKTTF